MDREHRRALRKLLRFDLTADEITPSLEQAVVLLAGGNPSTSLLNGFKEILNHKPSNQTLYPSVYQRMDELGLKHGENPHTVDLVFKRVIGMAEDERWSHHSMDEERVDAALKLLEYDDKQLSLGESLERAICNLRDTCNPSNYKSYKDLLRYLLKYMPKPLTR